MTRFFAYVRALVHWWFCLIHGIIERILGTIFMRLPAPFLSDWNPLTNITPPGAPHPPVFDPSVIEGFFFGILLRFPITSQVLEPFLPRGVKFPLGASGPQFMHPVNFAFGVQNRVHPSGLGFLPESNYLEFVIGVPNLQLETPLESGFTGPVAILARLSLNKLLPVILGRFIGFPKRLTRIHTTVNEYQIRRLWESVEVSAGKITPTGRADEPKTFVVFDDLKDTFNQPVVTRSMFDHLLITEFHWFWDEAILQEVNADIIIRTGLGAGHYIHHYNDDVLTHKAGAWRIRIPWTMRIPVRAANWKPQPLARVGIASTPPPG